MKICPFCNLNWIKDNETACAVCKPPKTSIKKLTKYIDYGGNSRNIYERFCYELNWDKYQINNFGYQKPLYAKKADAERKRDIWFIFHSNLNTNSIAENGKHLNIINEAKGFIAEYYEDSHIDTYPLAERIVFAKEKDGGYKFLGVYKAMDPYSREQGRIFIKISDTFPFN